MPVPSQEDYVDLEAPALENMTRDERRGPNAIEARAQVAIPYTAVRHALELMDGRDYADLIRVLKDAPRRRRGKGFQVLVTASDHDRLDLAGYLEERADVERDCAAFGDGADRSIMRACETAARRLRNA